MHMGRSLFDICDHDSIAPSRVTVMKWAEMRSEFAAQLSRARKALAMQAEEDALQVIENTTQANANANRVKMLGFQWLAKVRDPSTYADKPAGVQVNVSLDALVAGSYALENKAKNAKPIQAKLLDVAPKLTDNDSSEPVKP